MNAEHIYSEVGSRYSTAARSIDTGLGDRIAKAFGYSEEELAAIPKGANLGLSCGNPIAIATIREGETVVDLGCGAGFDVFNVANKVGASGRAIGVDMNNDMLVKARDLAAKSGKSNVEFVQTQITNIALDSGIADCIISNCVINLVPEEEKQLVFNEMFRLLKPGGRVAISDILAKKPLPETIRSNIALYVGCVAGASQVAEYERYLSVAGFKDTLITDSGSDLKFSTYLDVLNQDAREMNGCRSRSSANGSSSCCGGSSQLENEDLNEWVASFKIYAVKAA